MFNLFKKRDKKEELATLLNGYELPSFNQVIMATLKELRNPETSLQQIAKIMNQDPSLVMETFKMVNSSAFGIRRKINSLSQAVTLLGRAKVESIVLSHAVRQSVPPIKEKWFNSQEFWQLSSAKALITQKIYQLLKIRKQTDTFTAVLLQDLAIPILAYARRNEYKEVMTTLNQKQSLRLCELEQRILKTDHQTVGGLIADAWELPDFIKESITSHHHAGLQADENDTLAVLVELDYSEEAIEQLSDAIHEQFSLEKTVIKTVITESFEEAGAMHP